MKTHKERQRLKTVKPKGERKTRNPQADIMIKIISQEEEEQQLREERTRRATSTPRENKPQDIIKRIEKDTARIQKLRNLLNHQRKADRGDITQILKRVKFWLIEENKDKQTANKQTAEVKRILQSDYFDGYARNEQKKYITFDTHGTDKKETHRLIANRGEGRNARSYYIKPDLLNKSENGLLTSYDLNELMEEMTADHRNDYPTHTFLMWFGFSKKSIRRYIREKGREIVYKNSPLNYSKYGISTYYAIRQRAKGEDTHPYIIEEEISTPFISFLKSIRVSVANKLHPRTHRRKRTDTLEDLDF